jgi:2-C-methyl-D-erythritol 4-phosphate cytidylyltransferase/2-C-methyl-D-erythritol 2,4-cyclodiphosphate synthase
VEVFAQHPDIDEVILVVPGDLRGLFEELFEPFLGSILKITSGGLKRTDSTKAGLTIANPKAEVILVHDGVRPLVSPHHITLVIEGAIEEGAAILAVPVRDTLKKADDLGFISQTVDRHNLWQAQTPQGFRREILEKAMALRNQATDEASLVEALGIKVKLVAGDMGNIKITEPSDLVLAARLLGGGLRVGQGWDFHAFAPARPLFLGCIFIEDEMGLEGHSDADVLAHALVDALLGAASLGDIGLYFPSSEARWKGASGAKLLELAYKAVKEAGYTLVNADLTLIGQKPKISQYRQQMIEAMALAIGQSPLNFNLKGKTTEGLGFLGRGEGLAAQATVLLSKS